MAEVKESKSQTAVSVMLILVQPPSFDLLQADGRTLACSKGFWINQSIYLMRDSHGWIMELLRGVTSHNAQSICWLGKNITTAEAFPAPAAVVHELGTPYKHKHSRKFLSMPLIMNFNNSRGTNSKKIQQNTQGLCIVIVFTQKQFGLIWKKL